MDFKQIDTHTPKYYWDQFGQGFKSNEQKMVHASLYGLLSGFSQDFNTLCPNLALASKEHVRDAVDYLDRKYTATIKYFKQQGMTMPIPEVGYRRSFLESRPDIANIYGPDGVRGSGFTALSFPS